MHVLKLMDLNVSHVTTCVYFCLVYFYRPCPRSRRLKLPAADTTPPPERHEQDPFFVRVLLIVTRKVPRPRRHSPRQRGDGPWEAPPVAEMRTHGQRDSRH
jgi:hypothetical protein